MVDYGPSLAKFNAREDRTQQWNVKEGPDKRERERTKLTQGHVRSIKA